jgi:ureidoacrylate peracid hydrolase
MIAPLLTLDERLAEGRSALLVVDMQNDFCADGGYVSNLGRDTSPCRQIVPALTELIEAARTNAIPVIWLTAEYEDADVPAPMLAKKREMRVTAISCARASWGADFFAVAPRGNEPVIVKHSYSGFSGTDLDAQLRARNITTLVMTGVQTNVCVESTLREGHSRGYYIVVARDCVASHMPAQHQATLDNVAFLLGDVAESAAIAARWSSSIVS